MTWKEWAKSDNKRGRLPLYGDLRHPALPAALDAGADFLYMDNSYFERSPRGNNFRLIRGATHLNTLLERPDDRLKAWNPPIEPWRRNRSKGFVVIIPPSEFQKAVFPEAKTWLEETQATLVKATTRKVAVKYDKFTPLAEFLQRAWCVVTFASVAGLEAALLGFPVFAGPLCCCAPISAGSLEDIDRPRFTDRRPWLASLAYACWRMDELRRIDWDDYRYEAKSV